MADLNTVYRPTTWNEVFGQKQAVASMRDMIKNKAKQAFLLHGPSGVGKTTLARLGACEFGCDASSIMEIDAATHTGVESMRDVQNILRYKPILGGSEKRAIIVDECHRLSGQAWDSLLKVIEEPPPFVVWFFCTTNFGKVPKTIKTRAAKFELKSVPERELEKLVAEIADEEHIKIPTDVLRLVVTEANGSPREALNNLAICQKATSRREAADLLRVALESDATIELCRFLARPGSWKTCMAILEKLKDEPEGVRIIVSNYFGKAISGARDNREACFFLTRLEAFAQPFNPATGQAELMLAIGRVLFGGN